ncbi:splicing factor 3B subunit 2-like protein [Corchorus olitorius]|uniref:Splicing factor 3B subunit 2-like protein n=1 Tax=Corchorus olitorius TaxID=93759 RepID=A0A1R3KBE3_9ROSI|nr:splicing factor 3B subunit 2-like protein [Corchorus olitorius]
MKPGSLSHEFNKRLVYQRVLLHQAYYYAGYFEIWSSYIVPHLRIPGLIAPVPYGAGFEYHPGGWGKSPVDELDACKQMLRILTYFPPIDVWTECNRHE